MQINKYIGALILMLGLSTPAFANINPVQDATACEHGTVLELKNVIKEASEQIPLVVKELTKEEIAGVIEKIGPPPNASDKDRVLITRVDTAAGMTVLFFTEGSCFINKIGPLPTDLMNLKLGMTSAQGEKID